MSMGSKIRLLGDEALQYQLSIDAAALERERVSFEQVVQALRSHVKRHLQVL